MLHNLQWQAGSRQQGTASGFEPDKSNWGWNWLERWMAVRPWENRFLDTSLKDGMKVCDDVPIEANNAPAPQLKSTSKKPTSNIANGKTAPRSGNNSNLSNEKRATYHSDGSSTTTDKLANVQETSDTNLPGMGPKAIAEEPEEAISKRKVVARSHSNPKERSIPAEGKKRLSLPGTGQSLSLSHSQTQTFTQSHSTLLTHLYGTLHLTYI